MGQFVDEHAVELLHVLRDAPRRDPDLAVEGAGRPGRHASDVLELLLGVQRDEDSPRRVGADPLSDALEGSFEERDSMVREKAVGPSVEDDREPRLAALGQLLVDGRLLAPLLQTSTDRRCALGGERQSLLVPPDGTVQVSLRVLDLAEQFRGLREPGVDGQRATEVLDGVAVVAKQAGSRARSEQETRIARTALERKLECDRRAAAIALPEGRPARLRLGIDLGLGAERRQHEEIRHEDPRESSGLFTSHR